MLTLDRNEIEKILSYFHLITGFRVAVMDLEYNEVAACPAELSEFCTELRKNPEADSICRACDKRAFEKAGREKGLHLYPCDFGLYEACVPLSDNGKTVGYMMVGQMLSSKSGSKELVKWKSSDYWTSLKDQDQLLERMPVIDYKNIKASANLMSVCASYLTFSGQVMEGRPDREKEMLEYIKKNYNRDISDREISEKFNISRTSYYNAVKKAFGKTKTEYINNLRVENAKRLLASTHLTVRDISAEVGFNDQNYFSRVFRKFTGESPANYRIKKRSPNKSG